MKKAIILEGADNIGKSTLAKYLAVTFAEHHPTIVHCGPPPGDGQLALTFQRKQLRSIMASFHDDEGLEIWDRSIIGECVYGPMYRNYDHASYREELTHALRNGTARNIYNVVLYTDGEMYQRFKIGAKIDEKKAYQTAAAAPKISIRFVDVFSQLDLKNTLYVNCANYKTFDERNAYIMKRVRAWLAHKTYEHLMSGDYTHTFFNSKQTLWKEGYGFVRTPYVCDAFTDGKCELGEAHRDCAFGKKYTRPTGACGGVRHIKYIFVGEAPGEDGCGTFGIPFYGDRSGNLFQTTLDRLGVHPMHYYMTNVVKCCPENNKLAAYVDDGTRRNLECVQHLRGELLAMINKNQDAKIIALGKVASYELARFGMQHQMVYHPAYYLRMGASDDFYRELKLVMEDKHV